MDEDIINMAETLREVTELRLTAPDSHGRKGWKMKNKKNNLQMVVKVPTACLTFTNVKL